VTTATGTAALQFGVPSGTYCADRWYVLTQTTGVQVSQTTGDVAKNACLLTNNAIGVNQGFGLAQVVSAEETVDMRGSQVNFQVDFKNSNGLPVNVAILEWSGTADTVTKNVVSDWTKVDYSTATASGKFFAYTTLTVTAVNTVTPTSSATFTQASVQGTVSATANNLIVFVWTAAPWTSGSTMTLTQAMLSPTPVALDYIPRPVNEESWIVRKHFERIDLPSGGILANGFSLSSTVANATVHFGDKRVTPTATFLGLVADLTVTDTGASHAGTAVAVTLPTKHAAMVGVTVASGLTGGGGNIVVDSGNTTHVCFEISADL